MPQLEVVDQPVERVETIDALWRAIEALPVDLKMALLLRDVVGLSYNEIADSLEITLATVKWRIFKAREDVQVALAREGIAFGAAARAVELAGRVARLAARSDAVREPRGERSPEGRLDAISACVRSTAYSSRRNAAVLGRRDRARATRRAGRRRAAGRPSRG